MPLHREIGSRQKLCARPVQMRAGSLDSGGSRLCPAGRLQSPCALMGFPPSARAARPHAEETWPVRVALVVYSFLVLSERGLKPATTFRDQCAGLNVVAALARVQHRA